MLCQFALILAKLDQNIIEFVCLNNDLFSVVKKILFSTFLFYLSSYILEHSFPPLLCIMRGNSCSQIVDIEEIFFLNSSLDNILLNFRKNHLDHFPKIIIHRLDAILPIYSLPQPQTNNLLQYLPTINPILIIKYFQFLNNLLSSYKISVNLLSFL